MITPADIETDTDHWGYRVGARFASRDEWLPAVSAHVARVLHLRPLVDALAAAADDSGQLLDFRTDQFCLGPLSDALRDEECDDPAWQMEYGMFTAMVLTDATIRLLDGGYLATRGNGDSVDYRLTLPRQR